VQLDRGFLDPEMPPMPEPINHADALGVASVTSRAGIVQRHQAAATP
jgi:hypothetical protein